MGEIGSAAGLSAGTPAYFFQSNEELYRAVLGRAYRETTSLIRAWRFGETGFEDAVTGAVGSYLDFLAAHPNFVQLVIRDALEGGSFLGGLPEHLAAIGEAMPRLVGEQARGRLREGVDPAHLQLSAISLCWFPMVAPALTRDLGFRPDSTEFLESRKQQVSELLLRGRAAHRRAGSSREGEGSAMQLRTTLTTRRRAGSRTARGIALAIGAFYIVAGLWAFLAPDSFSSLMAPFPPFSRHLFHDLGAFQVGLGLTLVLAATTRGALMPALLAVLAASVLHLASHLEDRALGGHISDPLSLGLLCAVLAAAVVLERRATASAPGGAEAIGASRR